MEDSSKSITLAASYLAIFRDIIEQCADAKNVEREEVGTYVCRSAS
jgi:hypothetical protein